jgi:hypothetical protein
MEKVEAVVAVLLARSGLKRRGQRPLLKRAKEALATPGLCTLNVGVLVNCSSGVERCAT